MSAGSIRVLAVLLGFFVSLADVRAQTALHVDVTRDGAAVTGAEICFYSFSADEPFGPLTASGYRCSAADEPVPLEPGTSVAVFARDESGLTASHAKTLRVGANTVAAQSVALELMKGAHLDVSRALAALSAGERLVLAFGGTQAGSPYAIPIQDPATLVPAGVPLVPILITGNEVTGVGSVRTLREGETAIMDPVRTGKVAVVTASAVASAPAPADGEDAASTPLDPTLLKEQSPPHLTLDNSSGATHVPILPVVNATHIDQSLLIFPGIAPGTGVLKVSGDRWVAEEHTLETQKGPLTERRPVPLQLGGSIRAATEGPVALLLASADERCQSEAAPPEPQLSVRLLRCTREDGERTQDLEDCTSLTTIPVNASHEYQFEGLRPGTYDLAASVGPTIVGHQAVEVEVGKTSQAILSEPLGFFVSGRVTRDGEPVKAELRFRTGSTFSSSAGEFAVLLPSEPGASVVRISSCDQSIRYNYRPGAPLFPGSFLNIEIPDNEVEIEVRDARSGVPLPDAKVFVTVLISEDEPEIVDYFSPAYPEDGRHIARNLEEGRAFRITADLRGYASYVDPEPSMKKKGRERRTIELEPVGDRRGRVQAAGYRYLHWATAEGVITETAAIEEDGSFSYQRDHGPGAYVVLVGSAPLYLAPAPSSSEGTELEIPVQIPATMDVTVRVSDNSSRRNALVALWWNGVRIPAQALVTHQMIRRERMFVIQREPATYRDITAGNLTVALGPDPEFLPRGGDFGDPSLFTGAERKPVVDGQVSFD